MVGHKRKVASMEARIEHLETEHRTLLKRVEDLEKSKESIDFTLKDLKHETTIMHAIVVTRLDELKLDVGKIGDRLIRLDDRVTEAHKELAELRIEHGKRFDRIEATMATKDDISALKATQDAQGKALQEHTELLKAILDRLPPKQ